MTSRTFCVALLVFIVILAAATTTLGIWNATHHRIGSAMLNAACVIVQLGVAAFQVHLIRQT